jgi:hypothetical protein
MILTPPKFLEEPYLITNPVTEAGKELSGMLSQFK